MMKMLTPVAPGENPGDLFYGYPTSLGAGATHQWNGENWIQLVPELHSDGPAPAGMDKIPADMPNHDHKPGEIPLEYDLQTFNALVAANTAMKTELSAAEEYKTALQNHIEALKEAHADAVATRKEYQTAAADIRKDLGKVQDAHLTTKAELSFVTQQRDVLQRRLDRSLGFLDRVHDQEAADRTPTTQTVSAPRPSVGPDLNAIPEPRRDDGRIPSYLAGESIHMAPHEAYRRY